MLQNQSEDDHRRTPGDPTHYWTGAVGLTVAVGIAYFFAAELSLALLAKSRGLTMFWLGGGISSGVLIAFGRDARLPVASGTIVATVIAGLMAGRNTWTAAALALCNAGEALLAAWVIERYFGSRFTLDRLRNVLGLIAAGVMANAAGAVGGTVGRDNQHEN
jgi:integral membrane sensor domain MASE1